MSRARVRPRSPRNTAGRLYLCSRATYAFVGSWITVGILIVGAVWAVVGPGWLSADAIAWEVSWLWHREPRWIRLWEAAGVLLGIVAAITLSPRLASWETLNKSRLRPYAFASAVVALAAPLSVAAAASAVLPAEVQRAGTMTNVVSFAALTLIAVAGLGPFMGSITGLATYALVVVIQHAAPGVARHLPLAGIDLDLAGRPAASAALAGIAITVWTWTCGRSRLATWIGTML